MSKTVAVQSTGTGPVQPTGKKPMGQRIKEFFIDYKRQWELQSMIIPGVIFMFIFCYIPIYGLTIAFKITPLSIRWIPRRGLAWTISKLFCRTSIFGIPLSTRWASAS